MMNDQRTKKAVEALEHPETYPGLPNRDAGQIRLRLCHFPHLEWYWTWTVFKQKENINLRRIVWTKTNIIPELTLYASEVEISENIYSKFMKELGSIKIPPFVPTSIIGLDGETFHVESGDHHCSSKLQWWCDAPPGWEKLENWFHTTVTYFESVLPECTPKYVQ